MFLLQTRDEQESRGLASIARQSTSPSDSGSPPCRAPRGRRRSTSGRRGLSFLSSSGSKRGGRISPQRRLRLPDNTEHRSSRLPWRLTNSCWREGTDKVCFKNAIGSEREPRRLERLRNESLKRSFAVKRNGKVIV